MSERMKYYVVADVHGFYSELIAALKEKGFFEDDKPHKLVVCGDLFDRGEEAVKLQEFILDLMEKDEVILIRGNHEDLLVDFVKRADEWMTTTLLYSHHWTNGTVSTTLQLTGMELSMAYTCPFELKREMECTPTFEKILPKMLNYYETEKYIFVHGWIPCFAIGGYAGSEKEFSYQKGWREASKIEWNGARWYNGMAAANQGVIEPNKTIVCGHWHCSYGHAKLEGKGEEWGENADYTPYYGKGIIAIDGCTVYSHKVNCILLED